MTDKPVWLLDVDGVLNAVQTHYPPRSTGWAEDCWRQVQAKASNGTFPIVAAEPVLDFVRRVHKDGLAEVRWLTTWEDDDAVYPLATQLDLPDFPIAGRAGTDYGAGAEAGQGLNYWWKLPVAQKVYGERFSLLWTDDDISYHRPAKLWVRSQPTGTVLAVSPNSGQGLMQVHLDKIERWLTGAGE